MRECVRNNEDCIRVDGSFPLVSLLVPIYNVERYLRECLESAQGQTYENIEIICLNDGSTDGSRAIIQEFMDRDTRFRVVDKENSGYGATMNRGLDEARGEYIGILESDDFFEGDALEKLVSAAIENASDVVKANFWFYWSTPEERNEKYVAVEPSMASQAYCPAERPGIFYKKPSIWSALYRRSFLEQNDIRFLETPGASYQDAAFNFKVWAVARKAFFIDDAILHYRQDNEQSSVNSPSKVYCVCDEYAEMQRYLDERPELKSELQGVLERMKFDTYLWNYDRLDEGLKADFLKRASEELRADMESGVIDLSLFEVWAEADLRALISDSALFEKCRAKYAASGKLNTFKHYFALGGMPLVFKLIKQKFA